MPKIIIIADSPTSHTGVGGEINHIATKLIDNGFDVICLAIVNLPPNVPMPEPTSCKIKDKEVKIYPWKTDNIGFFFKLITTETPDAILMMQDPHFFRHLENHLYSLRNKIALIGFQVWDTYLLPDERSQANHYNEHFYANFDAVGTISHQTQWFISKIIQNQKYGKKPIVRYIGHGRDPNIFKPLMLADYRDEYNSITNNKEYDFIAITAGNNQNRKKISDIIYAWKLFNDQLSKEQAAKTLLIVHTNPVAPDGIGTNLIEVHKALAPDCNVGFSDKKYNEATLNKLWNCGDLGIFTPNAGGFELIPNEFALVGKCLLLNNVGGLWDQLHIKSDNKYVEWSVENTRSCPNLTYALWCYPVYGQKTIIGTTSTPYLFDFNADVEDIRDGILHWYKIPKIERIRLGAIARQQTIDRELTAEAFSSKLLDLINETLANFKKTPVPTFDLYDTNIEKETHNAA